MKQNQGNDIITLMPSLPGFLSGKQNSNWTSLRDNQGVKSQNIQMVHTTQYFKKNNKKWTEDLNRHFCKEDIQMANKHMKKMLNITHCQRNANQNQNELPSHTSQNGCYQKVYKQ